MLQTIINSLVYKASKETSKFVHEMKRVSFFRNTGIRTTIALAVSVNVIQNRKLAFLKNLMRFVN